MNSPIFKDLTSRIFGRWTVINRAENDRFGNAQWLCICICSKTKVIRSQWLMSGDSRSCGCLSRETTSKRLVKRPRDPKFKPGFKHGYAPQSGWSPTYRTWVSMISRCTRPNFKEWLHYGGANPPVKVCDRRLNSFEAFLEDMGERPERCTLGRFGDIGNYEKSNCAWQTDQEQKAEQKTKRQ